ncbi:MAG: response regulator [Eubacteriales bacterium]|nr:response regulator [Eubacteriales bacterium]
MREKRKKWYMVMTGIFMIAILFGLFMKYISFIGETLDKEVASQLSEVYGQINTQFNEMSEENWNLLNDGMLAYELSGSEALLDSYVEQLKKQWHFNQWFFVDENGSYIDTEGKRGYLNLGKDFSLLTNGQEQIVVDGTLAGSESVMLFAIPATKGTYKGFAFSAAALVYDKASMRQALHNKAYEGKADCFLLYPDGRMLLSMQDETEENKNLYTLLRKVKFENTTYEEVHEQIHGGESATWRYVGEKKKKYLYYQPVGFQNWMLVGLVPQNVVGRYVEQVLRQTIVLTSLSFGVVVALMAGLLYTRNRRTITRKNQEIAYREQIFELLSSNTFNMFVVIEPGTNQIEYASSNIKRILGFSDEDMKDTFSLLKKAEYIDHPDLKWEDLENIPVGGNRTLETARRHAKTGEKLWFDELVYHVKIGEVERYIVLLQDKTKEREDKRNLKIALDVAKAANESKSAFLSNVSHDIRTPMNVIIGFMPLLQRDAENADKVREYAQKINASSCHLLGLINDVLDMSKIESGKTSLNIREFHLANLIDEVSMLIRPQAAAKKQEFDIYVRDIRYENLLGDSMKISQIIVNILSNAVKYTFIGGKIEMRVQQLPQTTKNIVTTQFVISDNGVGMSEEYQKRIFEPFSREENAKTSKVRGTGLGMPIVKNLVDVMGGSISISSKPGEGSTFVIELGIRICEEEVDAEFWTKHHLFRGLVVDDDKDICDNVVDAVRHSGLEVEYALSGEEAVEKVKLSREQHREYNVVLLDWKMPGMDGLETARQIRKFASEELSILILSAYDWSHIEMEARDAGIDGFLSKPFFLSNFKKTVEQIHDADTAKITAGNSESRMKGKRFLVAEDYALNAEILVGILEMYGVSCDVCENGMEVSRKFENTDPGYYSLILMDIQMPVMNGYEATRRIRESSHPEATSIPIVAMSANAFAEDVQEATAAGMNAYLTKPVNAALLESTLVEVLEGRS